MKFWVKNIQIPKSDILSVLFYFQNYGLEFTSIYIIIAF
jgi:hypothetical protein